MNWSEAHKILEIEVNSDKEVVKKAYRKLTKKYHPDKPDGDEEKFIEIKDAYELIIKEKNNKDAWEKAWEKERTDWQDWFEKNNTDWGSWTYSRKLKRTLKITLKEAITGSTEWIGTTLFTIPPGVINGEKFDFKSENGIEYEITVNIINDGIYQLTKNQNIATSADISIYEAVLGTEHVLNFYGSKIRFKIPPKTNSNSIFRLKGKGYPFRNNPELKTDLLVRVVIDLSKITEKESAAFKKIKDLLDQKNK